jgi:ribosome-binding protein aMBF1 (putative translation factor)
MARHSDKTWRKTGWAQRSNKLAAQMCRELREESGYTQAQIAEALSVNRQHVARMESGDCLVPVCWVNGLAVLCGRRLYLEPVHSRRFLL